MFTLRKQKASNKRKVPDLWKLLKRPETYLALMFLFLAAVVIDTFRSPSNQITAKSYVWGVRAYQYALRPILDGVIECRYHPTCSEHSLEAVKTHGIVDGMVLTYRRITSCQTNVPRGTPDPVPPAHYD